MMLAADAKVGSFTRSLATEFDRALVAEGKPALNVFGVRAAFEAFDAACARTPRTYASFEDATGYPRDLYDERRAVTMGERGPRTDPEYDREYKDVVAFARRISALLVNGRDDAFSPTEAEARSQMSRHAKE